LPREGGPFGWKAMPLVHSWIPWSEGFLPGLTRHLSEGQQQAPWDLREVTLVVPTRQAGRRVREALAGAAADAGTGLLAPRTLTPPVLWQGLFPDDSAGPLDALAAWTQVLLEADLDEVREVFPHDPPRRDAAWALGIARDFTRAQTLLGQTGLDFAAVATRVADLPMEPDRWRALAGLEEAWTRELKRRGLRSGYRLEPALANRVPPPAGCRRLIFAGVLEFPRALEPLLHRWAESEDMLVEIVSHGEREQGWHDDLGRPVPTALAGAVLPWTERHPLRVVRDLGALAEAVTATAKTYESAPASLGLGIAEAAWVPRLRPSLEAAGLSVFDPGGQILAHGAVGRLVQAWIRYAQDDSLTAVQALVRHPLIGDHAVTARGWARSPGELVAAWDEARAQHLPVAPGDVAQLTPHAGLKALLAWLAETHDRLQGEDYAGKLRTSLAALLAHRVLRQDNPADLQLTEELALLGTTLRHLARAEARHPRAPASLWPTLLAKQLTETRRVEPRDPAALELDGWLELPFNDAPHLLVVGLHEGAVPERAPRDSLLPESLRTQLGLVTDAERLARDHLLLASLLGPRARRGRVDLLFAQLGPEGDPLQPSRLLFACADEQLVTRARQAFAELPPPRPRPARRVAWACQPPPVRAPAHFSPSALKAYLTCPFRYYLKRGLKMEALPVDRDELDALEFGTLCHAALEDLGRDETRRDVTDADALRAYLEARLEHHVTANWGGHPSLAVQLQVQAARARLAAAAEVEAGLRAEGWRTIAVEQEWTYTRDDLVFKGKIDRIDRHADGRLRVLDYKTSDRVKEPEQAHLDTRQVNAPGVLPEAVLVEDEGRPRRWTDLQLPLYLLALPTLRPEAAAGRAEAAYFCLPKTKSETALHAWSPPPAQLHHAETCALAAARAILAGRFWPPNPSAGGHRHDPLERLFPDGPELDVDATALLALAQPPPPGGAA
jgi:ATP-dependent helicase/nuclease subunit B